jgi:hypothetical protein
MPKIPKTNGNRDLESKASGMIIHTPEDKNVATNPAIERTDEINESNSQPYIRAVLQMWEEQKEIAAALGNPIKLRLAQSRQIAAEAKNKFANFSGISPAKRNSPLFGGQIMPDQKKVAEVHQQAIEDGVIRLKKQYQGKFTLTLSKEEIDKFGLTIDDGKVIQKDDVPVVDLIEVIHNRGGALDLVRKRLLPDWIKLPENLPDVLKDLEVESTPETGGTSTPTETPINITTEQAKELILNRIAGQLQDLETASLSQTEQRPDAFTISQAVEALKLTGGPADVTAFHDFKVLQLAFKDVWAEAFDDSLRSLGEQLYNAAIQHYKELDQEIPSYESFNDVAELKKFIDQLKNEVGTVASETGGPAHEAIPVTPNRGPEHGAVPVLPTGRSPDGETSPGTHPRMAVYGAPVTSGTYVSSNNSYAIPSGALPGSTADRLTNLILQLGQRLSEKYSFELFEPNSYNYGILLTYRQSWEPLTYQVGDLVSTIPLAPGETRKYSKKHIKKETRTEKQSEKSSFSRSEQTSETERAEAEIMRKTTTATNFSMASQGSFNIEMVNITASNQFGMNQSQDSANTKKDFHESTIKAAEEYRRENSLEVDVSTSLETEETTSGEISNPNNEITVTYLFYELQRRYLISEQLHRAQAVVLVAQEIPAPHEIDEAWLVANQWILARFLLDESLRPALEYLTSGFAGDEASLVVIRAHWQAQKDALDKLEQNVNAQLLMRDTLRAVLDQTMLGKDIAEAVGPDTTQQVAAAILTGGMSLLFGGDKNPPADMAEAQSKAAETRLKYAEEALADAQKKLQNATDAFQKATQEYTAALQRKYARHVAIDQLRVHVKENILYYMHGIWDCEPPDQRFFRLYNKPVKFFEGQENEKATIKYGRPTVGSTNDTDSVTVHAAVPAFTPKSYDVDLVEIADLDRPLGYKGNYIIFPLKKPCYLTTFMLQEYMDDNFGIQDPDQPSNWSIQELRAAYAEGWKLRRTIGNIDRKLEQLRDQYIKAITTSKSSSEEIIVPTGQLFVEALPGRHPLLEDFKLRHRMEDIHKVQAEIRHSELENLRLAARLVEGEREDPDIEKRILIDKSMDVTVNPD